MSANKYNIVETFSSIQGEGFHAGTPAFFIRTFGCNLACKFGDGFKCDEPKHTMAALKKQYTVEELTEMAVNSGMKHVVITGGEPSMQDMNFLILSLIAKGIYVQVETNGFHLSNISTANWITYSPKKAFSSNAPELTAGFNEVKVLGSAFRLPHPDSFPGEHKYLQPIAGEQIWDEDNVMACVAFVLKHPEWKLSLQTHKLLGLD
jgi:7-carboxy-7-deazaguanine synthase